MTNFIQLCIDWNQNEEKDCIYFELKMKTGPVNFNVCRVHCVFISVIHYRRLVSLVYGGFSCYIWVSTPQKFLDILWTSIEIRLEKESCFIIIATGSVILFQSQRYLMLREKRQLIISSLQSTNHLVM